MALNHPHKRTSSEFKFKTCSKMLNDIGLAQCCLLNDDSHFVTGVWFGVGCVNRSFHHTYAKCVEVEAVKRCSIYVPRKNA